MSATKVPSVGAAGPGYICETSRMRTRARSAAGDLQDSEAHLVGRSLAPEDVARLSGPERRVVAARDPHDVAGLRRDGLLEQVGGLPVEAPPRDLEQQAGPSGAGVQ